jgi:NADH:ubiquinone oxidoreductase subunit 6 (subunit J)
VYAVAGGTQDSGPAHAGAFGVQAFSAAFVNDYWLYFELVSLLLVAAVVAAVAVVRIGGTRRG